MSAPTAASVAAPASDAAARLAALDLSQHIITVAPAGSGKTGLLVQRMLAALATVDAPEQVVAITFTRKAAAEIRARVIGVLQRAALDHTAADAHETRSLDLARTVLARDAARAAPERWSLAANPERLRATTIDSLQAQIAAELPLLSGLGGRPQVVENASALYEEAVLALFAEIEDADAPPELLHAAGAWLRAYGNRVDRLIGPFAELLARREQWRPELDPAFDWAAHENRVLDAIHREAQARFADQFNAGERATLVAIAHEASSSAAALAACSDLQEWPAAGADNSARFAALAWPLLTVAGSLRKPAGLRAPTFAKGARHTELLRGLLAARADDTELASEACALRDLPPPQMPPPLAALRDALRVLLRRLLGHLAAIMGARGETDFVGVAEAARRALTPLADGSFTYGDALLRRDAQLRHLLVDEMQDTSRSQLQLLEALTLGWSPGDGRSLFLVGDPQQSIYAFRKAEVQLFQQLLSDLRLGALPLKRLQLNANFRSEPAVVDWFNAAFRRVFPAFDDALGGKVAYAASVAARAARSADVGTPQTAVRVHVFGKNDAAAEARSAAQIAAGYMNGGDTNSIAILVRARGHVRATLAELRRLGVRAACQDVDPLAELPAVRDVLALARALWHPEDRLAWAIVLRAPFVGLAWADLLALSVGPIVAVPKRSEAGAGSEVDAEGADVHAFTVQAGAAPLAAGFPPAQHGVADRRVRWSWPQRLDAADSTALSVEGRARVARLKAALVAAQSDYGRASLAERVETLWTMLGGGACVDAVALGDVRRTFALLREHAAGGLADARDFDRAVGELYAAAGESAVQVMTIHKAKGLEFDHVLLLGAGRKPKRDDGPLLHLVETPHGDLLVPQPPRYWTALAPDTVAANRLYKFVHELHARVRANEGLRLLYVAATRARRTLDITLCADCDDDTGALKPAGGSFAHTLLDGLDAGSLLIAPAAAAATPSGMTSGPPRAPRLPLDFVLPDEDESAFPLYRPPMQRSLRPSEAVLSAVEAKRDDGDVYAQLVGTLFHQSLEKISRDGFARWADGAASRAAALAAGFRRLGLAEAQVEAAVARVLDLVARTLASETGRWLLGAHPWARSEYALAGYREGRWISALLDRCFETADGDLWVVDYKAAARPVAADAIERYVAEGVETYRAQLMLYAELLAGQRPGIEVRAALYFPEGDRLVEYTP